MEDNNGSHICQDQIGNEVLDAQVYDDHGNPHHVALDDASETVHISAQTWAAVFFLGLSLTSAINLPLNTFVAVSSVVSVEL